MFDKGAPPPFIKSRWPRKKVLGSGHYSDLCVSCHGLPDLLTQFLKILNNITEERILWHYHSDFIKRYEHANDPIICCFPCLRQSESAAKQKGQDKTKRTRRCSEPSPVCFLEERSRPQMTSNLEKWQQRSGRLSVIKVSKRKCYSCINN